MAEATVVVVDPSAEPAPEFRDFGPGMQFLPLDDGFFSHHAFNGDDATGEDGMDDVVVLEDLDFDFSFDDLGLPPSDDLDHLLNPSQLRHSHSQSGEDPSVARFGTAFDQMHDVFKSSSSELRHISSGDEDFAGNRSCDGSGVLNSVSPDTESQHISGYLNMPSPESNGSNPGSTENCNGDGKELNCRSPESQDYGNFESNVSEDSNNNVARSVSPALNSSDSSYSNSFVNQKIKLEEPPKVSLLKRKQEGEDLANSNDNSRTNKYRKSNCDIENNNSSNSNDSLGEEDEKRKARLLRNRESAQLSRQRKKHYVEELEDKVRSMHSTIQDLNSKISYFMAENATLRQQMGGGAAAAAPPAVAPPPMGAPPPPPGMYTHPAMMYPWMPYAQPYMMKSQGSQVPLVPIPRLKSQQPDQAPKITKKAESKKNERPNTKKVAGVSFLGLLFFIMLFGGLAPMVNVRYGGARDAFTGGESYIGGGFSEKHHGRVLMVNGYGNESDEKDCGRKYFSDNSSVVHHCQRGQGSAGDPNAEEYVRLGNKSEALAASLYVPRNDKLVKIDGNLIIHSVLASEKAKVSNRDGGSETGLAVSGDLAPAIPGQDVGRNGARHPLLRALGAGDKDNMNSSATDGKLQQWFREGLAGPMLSAGMCTEVFQFDASATFASGAIVPASAPRNISEAEKKNSANPSKARPRNRRILHPLPFPESSHNSSGEHTGRRAEKEDLNVKKNTSSMVVSVLFDPRESSDADVDGVMGTKSLSRIFVVVLMDSVRYVTYSCMIPFKGAASHLVTA